MKEDHPVLNKFELETVPIGIGGKRMHFYRVGNWGPFIEKLFADGKSRFTDFPHWIKIWEASLVLADYLLDTGLSTQKSVLEIGAGMGITGMFLAAFGHPVVITDDDDDSLDLLRLNVEYNKLVNAQVKKLDWRHPDLTGQFDIICGAEAIPPETAFSPAAAMLRKHLKPDGRIYLAHDRQRSNAEKFISRLPADMTVETIGKTFRGKDTARRIAIHIIQFAQIP